MKTQIQTAGAPPQRKDKSTKEENQLLIATTCAAKATRIAQIRYFVLPRLCGIAMVSKTIATKSENKDESVPALVAPEQTASNKIKVSPALEDGSGGTILTLSTVSDTARKRIESIKQCIGPKTFFVIRVSSLFYSI